MSCTDTVHFKNMIRKLLAELDSAYHGITTLPKEHPARVAYNAALDLLLTT